MSRFETVQFVLSVYKKMYVGKRSCSRDSFCWHKT